MKRLDGICLQASFVLAFGSLVGTSVLFAQQNSAPAVNNAPAKTSGAPSPTDPNQSFTVQSVAPEDDESMVVIHSTTRRVVVDVVVMGPDGKPVPDLTEQDFIVLEDRKPQSVRGFEVHTPEQDRSLLPTPPPQLPSDTFINLEKTPPSGPPVVLLVDFLNTPLDAQAYAHEQIVHFLERKPASMEVAIYALGDRLSLMQGFTTDTGKLLAVMHGKSASMRLVSATEQVARAEITLDAFLDMGWLLATLNGRKNLLWFSGSFDMLVLPKAQDADHGSLVVGYESGSPNPGPGDTVTVDNLLTSGDMANSEASSSGFSPGISNMTVLRERMRKVATVLAVSQTAVYPIDVRGLGVDPGASASAAGRSLMSATVQGQIGTPGMPTTPGGMSTAAKSQSDYLQSLNATHSTMQEIAEATGGHAFVNTNGIALAASQAVSDGASYYTFVYAPSNLNFDGGLRTIHVTLDKPGYSLAYRSAYYAVDPASVAPDAVSSDSLAAAMVHGAPEAAGLLFKAQIDPDGPPAPAALDSPLATKQAIHGLKKSKKPDHLSGMVQGYDIRLAILAQQLQLTATPDGRHHASLQIAVYAYAADGQKLGGTKQNLDASMPPAVYERSLITGMFHNLKVELPVEAASLRLAIVDPGNHSSGSLEVALPLLPAQQAASAAPAVSPVNK